jgi:hypothetical protein
MPACYWCTHLVRTAEKPFAVCAAFPNGIPSEICLDGEEHTVPRDGDRGITFEPATLAQERALAPWGYVAPGPDAQRDGSALALLPRRDAF